MRLALFLLLLVTVACAPLPRPFADPASIPAPPERGAEEAVSQKLKPLRFVVAEITGEDDSWNQALQKATRLALLQRKLYDKGEEARLLYIHGTATRNANTQIMHVSWQFFDHAERLRLSLEQQLPWSQDITNAQKPQLAFDLGFNLSAILEEVAEYR
ncbi:MAG: hypothetical protein AAF352_01775 [Pseudomonadota bacterium]